MNHLVDQYFDSLSDKKVAVLGIGVSNRPLIRMLLARGLHVLACDKTPREKLDAEVLELERAGTVFTRDQLLNTIWGYEFDGESRTVDVHIRRLREKLEANPAAPVHIMTKWGVGYYFAGEEQPTA